MYHNVSAVILAGGSATRLGGIVKPKILVNGLPILERILSALEGLFHEIIIATNTPEEFADVRNCRFTSDEIKNAGPLGGIHAAMKFASADAVFVFGGDMPYINRDIVIRLTELYLNNRYDVVMPAPGKYGEPLHSIYSQKLFKPLDTFLRENLNKSVWQFINGFNVYTLQLEDTPGNRIAFTNINSPSDIQAAEDDLL
jgi:molybdenum cofactor guanylyltransferase